jgi:hypothetical protein
MFRPKTFDATPEHERIYGLYERLYTGVDMAAAWCFVIGSAMFFYEAWVTPGIWLFLIGSLFFAARPTIRLMREYRLAALPVPGDDDPEERPHERALDRGEARDVDDEPRARHDSHWEAPSLAETPGEPRPLSGRASPAWTPDGDIARRSDERSRAPAGADDEETPRRED